MSVGLPSVCLSVPAVQEQKVCTASVDRQTHHNSLILSQLMSWEEERAQESEIRRGGGGWGAHCGVCVRTQTSTCKHRHLDESAVDDAVVDENEPSLTDV